jgi:hypothetical protein
MKEIRNRQNMFFKGKTKLKPLVKCKFPKQSSMETRKQKNSYPGFSVSKGR